MERGRGGRTQGVTLAGDGLVLQWRKRVEEAEAKALVARDAADAAPQSQTLRVLADIAEDWAGHMRRGLSEALDKIG